MKINPGCLKLLTLVMLLVVMASIEGCGSGYEIVESNGNVYVQRKSWWKRMLFGP